MCWYPTYLRIISASFFEIWFVYQINLSNIKCSNSTILLLIITGKLVAKFFAKRESIFQKLKKEILHNEIYSWILYLLFLVIKESIDNDKQNNDNINSLSLNTS